MTSSGGDLQLVYLHETEVSSARGRMLACDTIPGDADGLELLLIAHPGEFDLVSSDGNAFLITFDRARGHDCGIQVGGSGRRRAKDSANLPARFAISRRCVFSNRKIMPLRLRVGKDKRVEDRSLLPSHGAH